MTTRNSLAPFLDAGFVHVERKCSDDRYTVDKEALKARENSLIKHKYEIELMQRRLQEAMRQKDVFELEHLLSIINSDDYERHINEDGEEEEKGLSYHLRYDIIKAQLCMSSYLKWRNQVR